MKSVNPALYTREYYLSKCSGYKEYKKFFGKNPEERLLRIAEFIKPASGMKILDVGSGRGELAILLAKQGARVCGIDYSRDAVSLARTALKKQKFDIRKNVSFRLMNAKELKFKPEYFDLVVSTEVWEHLYEAEKIKFLSEAKRVLKPNGRIYIHTEPNYIFNQFTYRFWCRPASSILLMLNRLFFASANYKYPNIPKWDSKKIMNDRKYHVGEPTYFSMKKIFFKSGLSSRIFSPNIVWAKPAIGTKDIIYNFFTYLYPLSNFFPLNIIWGQDFMVTVRKK